MATVQKKKWEGQTVGAQPPSTSGPQNATISNKGGGGSAVQPVAAPRSGSGRFTNIGKYLGANEGASQRIASKIGEEAKGIQEKTQTEEQDVLGIKGQAEDEKARIAQAGGFADQIRQTQVGSDISGLQQDQEAIQQLARGEMGLDVADLSRQAQEQVAEFQGSLGQLQSLNQRLGTERGRQDVLKQLARRPGA